MTENREANLPESDDSSQQAVCRRCGVAVPPTHTCCPQCGRTTYRTCFCGTKIPVDAATCPHCGADWSQSMRVARRKSRSRSLRRSRALRHAGIGAAAAIGLAAVAYVLMLALAAYGASGGGPGAEEAGGRLALAAEGLMQLLGRGWAVILRYGPALLIVIAVAAGGAVVGLGYYVLSLKLRSRRSGTDKRRVRRSRRR